MKKNVLIIVFLLIASFSFGQQDGKSMIPIMTDAEYYIDQIEEEYDQEIVRIEFDIVVTSSDTYRVLTSDYNYGILAFGDYRISDIDLKVYKDVDGEWTLITEDNEADSSAYVSVEPSYTGEYLIEITAYSFEEGYDRGHYGLIIYHP